MTGIATGETHARQEAGRGTLWLALLAVAILFHLALSLVFPEAIWTTSTGVGAVLLVALVFCLGRARAASIEMRWRWQMLALALGFWIAAFAAIVYVQWLGAAQSPRIQLDRYLYELRGVPYLLLLARSGDGDEGPAFRRIDTAQALLFSTLLMMLLFPALVPGGPRASPLADEVAEVYHDVENFAIAGLSLIGLIDQPSTERRRFACALSAMLVSYVALATPYNWFVIRALDPPPGSPANLIADVPAAILICVTLSGWPRGTIRTDSPRNTPFLQLLLPSAFCGASIAAAFVIAGRSAIVGLLGAGIALLLKAVRSALLQSRIAALQRYVGDVVERLPDALCVVGRDDVVTLGNEAASRLFGMAPAGQSLPVLIDGLGTADRDGGTIEIGDGRSLVVAAAPLPTGERIVRFTDVTGIRTIERDREEALQFLSHDIRSPHAAILAMLDHGPLASPPSVDGEFVERLRRHARHGLKMAEDFVQLARARTASIAERPVDIADATAEAADMSWSMARRRRIAIEGAGAVDGEIWVRGDRAMIVRAIHNLLDNGVKFAPEGSTIRYDLAITTDRARLRIESEGPELPPDRQRNPFIRFGTVGDSGGSQGLGLGLAFVHTVVERHGATVRHERIGDRHRFMLDFPLLPTGEQDDAAG
jgi:signal transduction histidine kinase